MATVSNRSRPRRLQIVTPEEELENLKNEVGVLRRAVESKSAAVGILRAELQECQKERDKFRTLAEQGGSTTLHRPPAHTPAKAALSDPGRSAMLSGGDSSGLAQLLCQAKEESRLLRQEATELKCRLHDAQADIKVLREEVQRWQGGGEGRRGSQANTALTQLALQERERFISQMEELSAKCQALEGDVRGLVDEREELVRELDATHHKLHRLNYILNTILSSPQYSSAATTTTAPPITITPTPPKRIVDLDAIITENRYLQQRLKQVEEEMVLARSNSSKYKLALERCRTQGSVRLGTSESLIVTPKQVSELLQEYRGEVGGPAESDLRSLCVALVDALGQRSRALRTQRSANRVLVDRVNELERRLMDQGGQRISGGGEGGHKGEEATPGDLPLAAQELMEGYTPPAGRGGLAWVKEEDASCDPRLSRFLGPLLASQSAHPRDTEGGGDGEVQVSGGKENLSEKWTEKGVDNENQTNVENRMSRDEASDRNQMNEEDKVHDGCAEDEIRERDKEEEEEEDTPLLPDPQQPQTFTDDALEEIVPLDQLDAYIKDLHMSRRRKAQKGREETEDKRSVKEEWKEMEAEGKEVERMRRETEQKQETDTQKREIGGDRKETKEAGESRRGGGVERERKETKEQKETETRKGKNETVTNEQQNTATEVADKINEENSDDESFDLDLSDYDSDNDKLDLELEEWRNDCGGGKSGVEAMSPVQGGNKKTKGGKREGFRLWKKDQKSGADEVELPSALQALLDKAAAATSMDSSSSGWTM